MAKYQMEVSDDTSKTDRNGKPVFPDTVSLTLHSTQAWRLVEELLAQLKDGEEWVFAHLSGSLEPDEDEHV